MTKNIYFVGITCRASCWVFQKYDSSATQVMNNYDYILLYNQNGINVLLNMFVLKDNYCDFELIRSLL